MERLMLLWPAQVMTAVLEAMWATMLEGWGGLGLVPRPDS